MTDTPEIPESSRTYDQDGRVVLTGISSRAFEHPADRAALTALRAIPGFDQVIKVASGMLRERQYRLVHLASAVRVDERQFPRLHAQLGEVCAVLDAPRRPELFVVNDPYPNAFTLGVDTPFVAVTSGLYELMDDDERRVVLGHELGHALSGHALYQSLLMHILNLIGSLGWLPASGLALRGIVAALREWQRKAELSGDRAGLLATQDPDACLRVHMKTAAGAHLDQIDTDAFLAQAAEYESTGDLRDGVLKLLNTEKTTHPFSVVRAAELRRWASSDEYRDILAGHYPHRDTDSEASFGENAREAARAYKQRIDDSTDPLVTTVRNVGTSIGSTFGGAADSIVDWFNRQRRGDGPSDSPPDSPPRAEQPSADAPSEQGSGDIFDWFSRRPGGPDAPSDGTTDGTPDNEPPDGPPPVS